MSSHPIAARAHGPGRPGWRNWALIGAAAAAVALRFAAVYRVAGNWDEFGLFEAASKTAESGALVSGGRPGLAQLLVLPLVEACASEIAVLQTARLGWACITFAYLIGLGVLIARLQPEPSRKLGDALLGVGLLALVPAFVEWSVQVRTDQLALAGAVWGGVALLASQRRVGFAFAAGLSFGIGFLSSQKLVYAAAAMGVLALGQLWIAREWRPKREASRAALCATAFALAVGLFQFGAASQQIDISNNAAAVGGVSKQVIEGGLFAFDFYRKTIGWSQYLELAPTLAPHALLLVALAFATIVARGREARDVLLVAWALLALGLAVGLFHAAAFAYFWMTLGLFPALAFAIARKPLQDLLPPTPALRYTAGIGLWLVVALPGAATMVELLDDSQRVQRESFAFVDANFEPTDAGFQPESGLFCRGAAQPIRHYYSRDIYLKFGLDPSAANRERLIEEFRSEQIRFVVESFRLNQFPVEVRRFWADNYQPYRAAVFVAGRRLQGRSGQQRAFDLIAPGEYRWLPESGPQSIAIDGRAVAPGGVLSLHAGPHSAQFSEDVPGGMLVLAMREPPGRAPLAFYKDY